MSDFIRGFLETNEIGSTYEGVVYDRFMQLRHASGAVLNVFNPPPPIASDLTVGNIYEFALESALPRNIQLLPGRSEHPVGTEYAGAVVDLSWHPKDTQLLVARPSFFEMGWVLLQTSLGQLLMNPNEILTKIQIGTKLQWSSTRLDLQAVIQRCEDANAST